ncbi:endo alpha-1,4 polygalactosaminidase [Paenibacillus sp. YYML68]|uniref:endo alpha-1,4 polygalactosaminidase n=1 Tax=Paenibacillus sp. YYML68 TaxID=2909250 RepID=UPI0024928DEF|nr:endo alpha-1,4 polygalactosaminidase [Paenibacillus sp. YYML68]
MRTMPGKRTRIAAAAVLCVGTVLFMLPFWKVKKGPLHEVKSFQIYYGPPSERTMAELTKAQLAVIEPQSYTASQVEQLKLAGTMPAAYISVMETPAWNRWRLERLQDAHYLIQHGRKVHIPQWDAYLMDLRRPEYRELLLEEIGASAANKGFGVVFLDTVGDIDEYVVDPGLQQQLRDGYRELLRSIRERFGTMLVIQNRGFDSLSAASGYIHGFLWEDWQRGWKDSEWVSQRVDRLRREQRKGVAVFSVSIAPPGKEGAKEAAKLKYVHWDSPYGYDKLHD